MTATPPTTGAPPAGTGVPVAASRALPIVAVAVFAAGLGVVLAVAGSTLGYDARAYFDAAHRLLAGQPIYDPSIVQAGPAGEYYYPPPFALLTVPFALLPDPVDIAAWLAALVIAFGLGVAILPVASTTRWLIVLLAGLSWPFAYAVKLGQVGPVLFLCFAVGWRWLDRPARLGLAMALGAIVKIQPAILFVWAALSRRWAAVGFGLAVLAVAAVAATIAEGFGAWSTWLTIVRSISAPITTPHNFTPGALAYQAGLSPDAADVVQIVNTVLAVVLVVWAALRAGPVVGYLTAATASQLLSPVLWDHYAMLLLLPTAWLLDRRRRWAALIPLLPTVALVGLSPIVYPISFWIALVAPIVVERQATGRLPAQRPRGDPVLSSGA